MDVVTTKVVGDDGEARALAFLTRQGLVLLRRNYRVARGPSAQGGEIDIVMRDHDGTLVFVEVRKRRRGGQVAAAETVSPAKRRSLVYAAQRYLMQLPTAPPCRFDVIAIDGERIEWLRAAFDAE